jgi:SAM-dependent methyltransferase
VTTAPDDEKAAVFPEVGAGGYSRVDGTVEFWARVNALLPGDGVAVDLGAGRGQFLDDPVPFRRSLHDIGSRCHRLVGLDVDPAVHENPALHEAHVIPPAGPFPLADASVDLLVSDWTFEHVADPAGLAAEIDRVLVPGGWVCARTPRKWGAIGIPTMLVPDRLHVAVLRRLQPAKAERDTFPTAYRLNSRAALREHFPVTRWAHHVYEYESEPAYVGRSATAMRAGLALQRLVPARASSTLMVFLRKVAS